MLSRFSLVQLFANPGPNRNPPGSSVHGILQARILESVACPPPDDLHNPGIEPPSLMSLALAGGFFTTSTTWEAPKEDSGKLLNTLQCKRQSPTRKSIQSEMSIALRLRQV